MSKTTYGVKSLDHAINKMMPWVKIDDENREDSVRKACLHCFIEEIEGDSVEILRQAIKDLMQDGFKFNDARVRFVDNNNGTITDVNSGMMWQKKGLKKDTLGWKQSNIAGP